MLTQYLVLLGANNSRKSKMRSDNTVNSPKDNLEIPFPFGSGKLLHRFPKIHFTSNFRLILLNCYKSFINFQARALIKLNA